MDTANPGLPCMLLNPDITSDPAVEAQRTATTREWFKDVLKNAPHADIRALRNGMLFQQIVIADDRALVSPYLYSATTGFSPRIDMNKSCPVFDVFLREFNRLWDANEPS
jgi:hypothetical protein